MSDFEYLTLKSIAHSYKTSTPSELVSKYYPLWADNKFAWITLLPLDVLLKRCAELELQKPHLRGELWGVPFAVKDNIHYPLVAPTTCACKTYQYQGSIKKRCHVCCVVNGTNDKGPTSVVVEELVRQGAIVVGKSNMDQFAAGLNGTRSPFGTARNAFDERFIPGGSSSGSGALVGSGVLPFALGTDTAGSGRVPAHFNGCIGVKGTVGLVSTEGVVPACRSLDCLTIFCASPSEGRHLLEIASRPRSRASPSYRALPSEKRRWQQGPGGSAVAEASRELFSKAIARLERLGGVRVPEFDFAPFAETAQMLYGNAFIAERTSGIRGWLTSDPLHDERLEKIERQIMSAGLKFSAVDAFDSLAALANNAARARVEWDKIDVLMTPTALHHYTVEELERDEKLAETANGAKNSNLGKFTNYMNLLDCCAIAVPSGLITECVEANKPAEVVAGIDHVVAVLRATAVPEEALRLSVIARKPAVLPWGVTLVTEAFGDWLLLDVAEAWVRDSKLQRGPKGHHLAK